MCQILNDLFCVFRLASSRLTSEMKYRTNTKMGFFHFHGCTQKPYNGSEQHEVEQQLPVSMTQLQKLLLQADRLTSNSCYCELKLI